MQSVTLDKSIFQNRKVGTENKSYLLFYIVFLMGLAGHFLDNYLDLMLVLTPFVLLITGTAALILSGEIKSIKFIVWFVAMYLFTLSVEIAGVITGNIFGEYTYGNVLGYKFAGVPLIIGFNWLLVILGVFAISNNLFKNKFLIIIASALLAVLFDYIIEPVAMNLNYWQWEMNTVPVQNYFAWFIVSLIALISLMYFNIKIHSKIFIHYFICLIIFFLILNFR